MNGYCSGSLQDKEVINICDGSRLGYVCDLAVDSATGRIISISVPGSGSLFQLHSSALPQRKSVHAGRRKKSRGGNAFLNNKRITLCKKQNHTGTTGANIITAPPYG